MKNSRTAAVVFICFLISGFAASAQQPAPTPVKSPPAAAGANGTIEGQVTDDEGKPITDARVAVSVVGETPGGKNVTTDEAGKFLITRLTGDVYRVYAGAPGFVTSPLDQRQPGEMPKFYHSGERVAFQLIKGGVITGSVVDSSGTPMVGLQVRAVRMPDPNDRIDDLTGFTRFRETDDRGVYRIYGLPSGKYMVVVGGSGQIYSGTSNPFDRDAPTYYPSSTRDTASTVSVETGQEVSGIDIRYRGERGFTLSGKVVGPTSKSIQLSLKVPAIRMGILNSTVRDMTAGVFEFLGAPNGDYKLFAQGYDDKFRMISMGTINLTVKNADVTGISIRLNQLASVRGRIAVPEKAETGCENPSVLRLSQSVVSILALDGDAKESFSGRVDSAIDYRGSFAIPGIIAANYRLRTSLPVDDWYIRSITRDSRIASPRGGAAANPQQNPELLSIGNGENISGLTINALPGGGAIRGSIAAATGSTGVPLGVRFFLIPTEKDRVDDVIRYAEAPTDSAGSFSFRNLAPGNYLIAWRVVQPSGRENFRPLAWDAKERVKLRHEAETSNLPIEVKPCQGSMDLGLVFGADGTVKKR